MNSKILNEKELLDALAMLDGWAPDGTVLKKSRKFENFAEALEYVNKVGALAEAADHHPDITFGWGYADLALTTHDRGGITDMDISLAAKIDGI